MAVNIIEYVQHRQYGRPRRGQLSKHGDVESLLEEKVTNFLTNKACSLSGHCRSTFIMDFSPDGSKVASTHGDHTVRVTDIATGQCIRTLQGHPRTPWCLAYHPSSSHILASGCLAGQVRIWDLYGQGCEVWQTDNSLVIASMTFHPIDHVLVFAAGNTIYFWDWSQPEPFARCNTKHEYERIRFVRFGPLGHFLYTGISNNTSIHRDEVAGVSLPNHEPSTSTSGAPGRLNTVYNNLMNCYREYRQDRVMQQVGPRLRRDPEPGTSTADDSADIYPGLSDDAILRPTSPADAQYLSMARQYAADVTEQSGNQAGRLFSSQLPQSTEMSQRYSLAVTAPTVTVASSVDLGVNTSAFLGDDSTSGDSNTSSLSLSSSSSVTLNDGNTENVSTSVSSLVTDSNLVTRNHSANPSYTLPDIISNISGTDVHMGANSTTASVSSQSVECFDDSAPLLGLQESFPLPAGHDGLDTSGTVDVGSSSPATEASISGSGATSQTRLSDLSFENGFLTSNNSDLFGESDLSNVTHTSSGISLYCSSNNVGNPSNLVNMTVPSETLLVTETSQQNGTGRAQCLRSCTEVPGRQTAGGATQTAACTVLSTCSNAPISSLASCSNSSSLPHYLRDLIAERRIPEFLHNRQERENPSTSRAVPGFLNIRDRLKSCIPLSTSSSSGSPRPVRVISAADGSDIARLIQSGERQTVNTSAQRSTALTRSSCLTTSTVLNHVRVVPDPDNTLTSCSIPSPRVTSTQPVSCPSRPCLANNSSRLYQGVSAADPRSTADDNLTQFRGVSRPFACSGMASLLSNYSPLVSTVVASTSSHASLFQNIYHNTRPGASHFGRHANTPSGRIQATNLSSVRARPYFQSRARCPTSIMGPYLESRGYSLPDPSQNHVGSVSNQQANSAQPYTYRLPADGGSMRRYACLAPAVSRDQTASDTENELSSHLPSDPYFLPISEGQTRAYSSQSTRSTSSFELSTDPLVSRRSADSQRSSDSAGQVSPAGSTITAGNQVGGLDINMAVDNNNVSTQRNNNLTYNQNLADNRTEDHDSNNNTIPAQPPQDYVALRDNFVTMRDRIEREMGELNRRLTALRERFNESLDVLRRDQERYRQVGQALSETGTGLATASLATSVENSSQLQAPTITVTRLPDAQSDDDSTESAQSPESPYQNAPLSQPATLLESSLRSHHRVQQLVQEGSSGETQYLTAGEETEGPHWRSLQRNYLHPHYSSSILDDTINRPNNAIQSAINRAIAGAFMGTGEPAVANNIINQTHRIQFWDFTKCLIPDITQANVNIVVPHCKLHNDASCDLSQNGTLLATFVPSHRGFPDNNILAVYSLRPGSRGQCLYTKSFGPNAISISISPKNQYVMVGLAAKRLSWVFSSNQMVAQIYQFDKPLTGEMSMKHVKDIMHPCSMDIRTHVRGNSARWLPRPGQGLVYGTNRGDLHLCKPGVKVKVEKMGIPENVDLPGPSTADGPSIRRNLMQMLVLSNANLPRTFSISTQTNVRGIRHSITTQTDNSDSD